MPLKFTGSACVMHSGRVTATLSVLGAPLVTRNGRVILWGGAKMEMFFNTGRCNPHPSQPSWSGPGVNKLEMSAPCWPCQWGDTLATQEELKTDTWLRVRGNVSASVCERNGKECADRFKDKRLILFPWMLVLIISLSCEFYSTQIIRTDMLLGNTGFVLQV